MLDAFAEVSSGAIFSAAWSALSFAVSAKPCAASAATGIFSLTLSCAASAFLATCEAMR